MIYDHLIDLSIFILYICNPKSAEKAPIKAAILNSLRGKYPTNNKSDDYKNLPYF